MNFSFLYLMGVAGVGIFIFIALSVLILVWLERKVAGHIQSRMGPMRVGWHGLVQTLADMVKLISKESILPAKADKWLFFLAPFVVFIPAYLSYMVIPFAPKLIIRDFNIGLLYFLAIPSISVVGIIMAGWGSNNKYALLGGLRSAAQIISYEIPRALSVVGVVMLAGSMSTVTIVKSQSSIWFILLQPLGFLIYFISTLAEVNRIPFDLPEAESELVAGFHTEYSGIKWSIFMMSEYANVFAGCALCVVLFLGGWHGFLIPKGEPWSSVVSLIWFMVKTLILIFLMMWLRWTLPRFRVDQLMDLSWKVFLPLALINIGLTGLFILGALKLFS